MGYGYQGMMNWSGGPWVAGLEVIIWLVVLIDLILLGFWLFKQVEKK